MRPVKTQKPETRVPESTHCPICSAPSNYLYFNDGKKRSQIQCKVCGDLFQAHPRFAEKTKYWCPHCSKSLYLWKHNRLLSVYKCGNDRCPAFEKNKRKLNPLETLLRTVKSSQYKLRYQFREYHFTQQQLAHAAPAKSPLDKIFRIHNNLYHLCLVLTFHISLGISARKTAYVLSQVFELPTSHQTVHNYSQYAAYYCHQFNMLHKGPVDSTQAGDETYIKIAGKHAYAFFFVSPSQRKISAYHVDHSRDTLPATIAMNEAIRTAPSDQPLTLVTDGNPAYQAGIHFLNNNRSPETAIDNKQVIGLQNLDLISEEYRPFKQILERLNRTYKYHVQNANGFNATNGAVILTTLFVTFYNFIRPHTTLGRQPPIPWEPVSKASTIQGKWAEILHAAFQTA